LARSASGIIKAADLASIKPADYCSSASWNYWRLVNGRAISQLIWKFF